MGVVAEHRDRIPTFADVNRDVGRTLGPPGDLYFAWMSVLGLLLVAGILAWTYQIWAGMGAAGKRTPQMWAMYITSFVFWIGIGHAGTYLLPYPSQRDVWPNFKSPLVWDVFAISTYLTISTVFFIVGLVPDLAALRDGASGWRRRIYGMLALGWEGSHAQWRHYRRAYGLFAALATPLVLSVHSVVSLDFAMALVPGWHSTLFAPFFVDGAIFSGFAMVLVLVLPMRRFFDLYPYIQDRHLDAMGKLLLVTSLVLTYFYICEIFTAWYSGDHFERASLFWRVTRTYAWALWLQYFCNSVAPLVLFWRRARVSPLVLYLVSILVLIGMWFERFNIIVASLAHDFYPYTWGIYVPTLTDTTIVIASFAWFFLLFLGVIRLMPSVSIVEVKETLPPPVKEAGHGGLSREMAR